METYLWVPPAASSRQAVQVEAAPAAMPQQPRPRDLFDTPQAGDAEASPGHTGRLSRKQSGVCASERAQDATSLGLLISRAYASTSGSLPKTSGSRPRVGTGTSEVPRTSESGTLTEPGQGKGTQGNPSLRSPASSGPTWHPNILHAAAQLAAQASRHVTATRAAGGGNHTATSLLMTSMIDMGRYMQDGQASGVLDTMGSDIHGFMRHSARQARQVLASILGEHDIALPKHMWSCTRIQHSRIAWQRSGACRTCPGLCAELFKPFRTVPPPNFLLAPASCFLYPAFLCRLSTTTQQHAAETFMWLDGALPAVSTEFH